MAGLKTLLVRFARPGITAVMRPRPELSRVWLVAAAIYRI
jgi:hypothetical protein